MTDRTIQDEARRLRGDWQNPVPVDLSAWIKDALALLERIASQEQDEAPVRVSTQTDAKMTNPLLNRTQAAEELQKTRQTLIAWQKAGILRPDAKINGRSYYTSTKIERAKRGQFDQQGVSAE